jgi:hypothetical protein
MDSGAEKLNEAALLPPHAYRRNHLHYELVCYVNCLAGCRISGNAEGETLFKDRIERFIAAHPATSDLIKYYEAVTDYITPTR